ncbi:MAG: DUF192 domain-containing protein [Patescibacteria group bacterium]|jgi:uncharacterized membrane protein (UPF0127 family)
MKKPLLIALAAVTIVIVNFWWLKKPSKTVEDRTLVLAGKTLQVEIAQTESEREQGLSDRPSLCESCGMLFIFDSPGFQSFWMRRMHFDIDMIWINGNKIVDITPSAKKPEASEFDSPKIIYTSKVPADKILEVNAGWTEKNGVKVGDEIALTSYRNKAK